MAEQQPDKQSPQDGLATSRMLACVRCQRSKIKCDRTMPCSNCVRRNIQCIPGTAIAPRQRRKRFPERELLDRLRNYEALLRDNKIAFDPLHKDSPAGQGSSKTAYRQPKASASDSDDGDSDDDRTWVSVLSRPGATNFWDVMVDKQLHQHVDANSDDSSFEGKVESKVRDMWANAHQNFGFLLPFGQPKVHIDLSDRHPDQATIFKLWQIYLDNVNPLLKVTHTPTLQGRIVTAATNVAAAGPALTALMFSIYCVAVLSLREIDCQQLLGATRHVLLTDFQLSCQQALANCGVLKTSERECLTAFYLYIVSVEPTMDPYSISSLMGVAMRVATRMGLQNEFSHAKLPALEAELRRRLWWSLVIFDTRVAEMSGQPAMLVPTWDCALPANLNDFELQPEMRESPKPQSTISEAVFVSTRTEMSDCLRHAAFYLDFINPVYKLIALKNPKYAGSQDDIMDKLEQSLEERYVQQCNQENSVHTMATWMTRELMGKNRLLQHYSKFARAPASITDADRDDTLKAAMTMLDCDAKLMNDPAVRGFQWYLYLYFPFSAYFHILQDLRKRPACAHSLAAWNSMSANYEARFMFRDQAYDAMFNIFAKMTLTAWYATEEHYKATGTPYPVLPMITHIQTRLRDGRQAKYGVESQAMQLSLSENWTPLQQASQPTTDWSTDFSSIDPSTFGAGTFGADLDANGQSFMGMLFDGFDFSMPDLVQTHNTGF